MLVPTLSAALNVHQRLRAVRMELSAIEKKGTSHDHTYAYIRYDDVAAQIGDLMTKHGLVTIPKLSDVTTVESGTSHAGNTIFSTKVKLILRVVNVDKPEDFVEAEWWGEANDNGDKGIQKAATSATKFCQMKLLQIGGAEDTEADPVAGAAARPAAPSAAPECAICSLQGFTTSQGKTPRMYPGKFGVQCNGMSDGKYMNHKGEVKAEITRVPTQEAVTDREYLEGDACPFEHTSNWVAKFKLAKGGPHKGLLQCNGKDGEDWASHLAPPRRDTSLAEDDIPF